MAMTMETMEEYLVQAWKEVFDLDEVSYDANFFELGGDSIKAVQLAGWLLQKGVKLDMMNIFTYPTIEELIPLLEETAPMYLPPSIINKEKAQQMKAQGGAAPQAGPAPQAGSAPQAGPAPQPGAAPQLCTPQGQAPQLCTPQGQPQLCTPQGQQLCSPQQLCTPQGQQLCSPQQLCTPQGIQALLGQLQQIYMSLVSGNPQLCTGGPGQPPIPGMRPAGVVDKPIENPSVIEVEKPHVKKPTVTAEVALDIVLRGILNKPYGKDDDLFKIGLNDFAVMQIVTRCAEQGYSVDMKDIFANRTFNTLVTKLVPGNGQ